MAGYEGVEPNCSGMKKLLHAVTAFVIAFAMVSAPVTEAQGRGRQTSSNNTTSAKREASQPRAGGNSGKHQSPSSGRGDGGRLRGNDFGQRPGNGGGVNRPSAPSGNHRQGNRPPGGRMHDWTSPARPQGHHRPSPPPPTYHHNRPPHHVPFFATCHRPVPPPRWHYHGGGPSFGTILGVALGTAIGVSINTLVGSGYTVSSYGNDVVYLTNVPQMNYMWPDAALYYENGLLYGSQFTCPSAYYDLARYNSLYGAFTAQYGMPVQTVNRVDMMSATWYGAANRFVTLSFGSQGGIYYTTLSFGN